MRWVSILPVAGATLLLAACGGTDDDEDVAVAVAEPLPAQTTAIPLPSEPLDRASAGEFLAVFHPEREPLARLGSQLAGSRTRMDELIFTADESFFAGLERESGLLSTSGWIMESAQTEAANILLERARSPDSDPDSLLGRTVWVGLLVEVFETAAGARAVMETIEAMSSAAFAQLIAEGSEVDRFRLHEIGIDLEEPVRSLGLANVDVGYATLRVNSAGAVFQRGPLILVAATVNFTSEESPTDPDVEGLEALAGQIDARIGE